MRGPVDLEHGVRDRLPETRERLLQLGLVVDVRRQRVLDPSRESRDDRVLDLLEPVLEEERAERGLEQRGQHVPVPESRVSSSCGTDAARSAMRSPSPSSRATTAQLARDTTCERILASCPSEKSGYRSYSSRATASSSTLSPRNSSRSYDDARSGAHECA